MGDASEDMYEASTRDLALWDYIVTELKRQGCRCKLIEIKPNDDGLYECGGCGRSADY